MCYTIKQFLMSMTKQRRVKGERRYKMSSFFIILLFTKLLSKILLERFKAFNMKRLSILKVGTLQLTKSQCN